MRALLLLSLLVIAALPALHAQAEAPAGALLVDPAADVKLSAGAAQPAAPDQMAQALDLRSLRVNESRDAFLFTLQVTDIKKGSDAAGQDGQAFTIEFRHGTRMFRIQFSHQTLGGASEGTSGYLSSRDDEKSGWSYVQPIDSIAVDDKAETYAVELPRVALADAKGTAPYLGRVLEGFKVHSDNLARFFVGMSDDMPDAGVSNATYAVQFGARQEGHARLTSDEPFRASNGEATTFLMKAKAQNTADYNDTFHLTAVGLPSGWSVALPVPVLDLGDGGEQEFPVLVTVPFNHAHGTSASFVLEMRSATDTRTVGRLEMGVRYLTIPQPAGHHSTLTFHSRANDQFAQAFGAVFTGQDGVAFMNAMDPLPGDAGLSLAPDNEQTNIIGSSPYVGYTWCVPLDPGLQMGLDFIVKSKAHLTVPIHASLPMNGAFLKATLTLTPAGQASYYTGCGNYNGVTVLASLNKTSPKDIAAGSDAKLEGDLDIWRNADRVPYVKGQDLALQVEVWAVGAPTFYGPEAMPRLIPGGTLTLPLLEYRDELKAALATSNGPPVSPLGPQERVANPGATILFPMSFANEADQPRDVALNVTGGNVAWAHLPASVQVPAHGLARADVTVVVPADAKDGERADLVLQAYDQANVTQRTLLRLVVTVDTLATHPDDAPLATTAAPKKSPSAGPLMAAGLLALAAWVARSRPGRR